MEEKTQDPSKQQQALLLFESAKLYCLFKDREPLPTPALTMNTHVERL
jgi:hypothetical protein